MLNQQITLDKLLEIPFVDTPNIQRKSGKRMEQIQKHIERHNQDRPKINDQMSIMFTDPPLRSLRSCPNSKEHPVFGTPLSIGGREFYCAECGIEWQVVVNSNGTGIVRFYDIRINGEVRKREERSLMEFAEGKAFLLQRQKEKRSCPPM